MRKFSLVTTFNDDGYKRYGQRMIETFIRHWDKAVDLYVYYEGKQPSIVADNVHYVNLLEACPNLVAFKKKYKNDPVANGRVGESPYGIQRPEEMRWMHQNKESFLYQAVRFSHKVFAVIHASRTVDTDILIWVDADVVTYRDIPLQFISDLTPNEHYTCYLKRHKYYPECGFVSYNTKHSEHNNFMNDWEHLYISDELFNLKEWHDSYVYGELVDRYESQGLITTGSYSGEWEKTKHPFVNGPLGEYMDHLKGNRKVKGKSLRMDIHNKTRLDGYFKDAGNK